MTSALRTVLAAGILAVGGGWYLTAPDRFDPSAVQGVPPDLALGETLFYAGGCVSCHSAPGAEGDAKLVLSGGQRFPSDFGTFIAPNISADPEEGIGEWTSTEFANALLKGTSPDGTHYYPVFPYTSYARMSVADAVSLHAYLQTLPTDATASAPHEVGFPFSIRRFLGGWKWFFATEGWIVSSELSDVQQRGRYLVEGPGHCGECHTARNALGGLDRGEWLAGAPSPDGKGRIPDITPGGLDWSEADIAEYLKSGFTPEYDSAGGEMAAVIENTSQLTDDDRAAIAAYLKAVPASR
ncbi:c-type cytochrome [Tropicimonas marinistellae]|uniref:c-type cytochrome n=1 Tax=Tropicimonas marinistellae TaxID=1739787 RepID=UPI00083175D7|nr:cytochrome c [Tropicimonas marinistellae]